MANNDYINRNFNKSIKNSMNTKELGLRFTNTMNSVLEMIQKDGPVYHTWISFQIGKSQPLIFNTDSTDPNKNLITSLDVEKSGSYTCNSFSLKLTYDPFRYGQDTKGQIEQLDEWVANAMSYDFDSDDDNDNLRGYLQYGYSSTSANDLVSPYYEFLLTNAESKTKVSSGIINYTFEGTCIISQDCDFTAAIGSYPKSWKVLDVVLWTLFYHYGDNANRPSMVSGTASDNPYKYEFDCPEELYDDSPTLAEVNEGNGLDAIESRVNPISYCTEILSRFPLTKSEISTGEYDVEKMAELNFAEKPRFMWYITDTDGKKTFHITHYTPKTENIDKSLKEECMPSLGEITWGTQNTNIVVDWNPQADTMFYLINKAKYKRIQRKLDSGNIDLGSLDKEYSYRKAFKQLFNEEILRNEQAIVREMYDAEITLVGIPADIPICGTLKIIPKILESVSRTAGTYVVKGASDHITSNGVYTTTIQLFRVDDNRGTYAEYDKKIAEAKESMYYKMDMRNFETNANFSNQPIFVMNAELRQAINQPTFRKAGTNIKFSGSNSGGFGGGRPFSRRR